MESQKVQTKISGVAIVFAVILFFGNAVSAQQCPDIFHITLQEDGQETPEISTYRLAQLLQASSARVFDVRPFKEYAVSHIPGAISVSAKPGVSKALYVSDVAEIGRIVGNDRDSFIVIYCNGPFCGKSKRVAKELSAAGYSRVYRYQLGIPVWRALGYVTQTEIEGIRYVFRNDKTAVFIDARDPSEFRKGSLPGAVNIPKIFLKRGKDVGEVKKAKNDGRLPMNDHNTRIIVFGKDGRQARAVASALAKEAFHNTSFYDGSFKPLISALNQGPG